MVEESSEEDRELGTIDRFLRRDGQTFVIYRGGEEAGEATGLKDGRQRSIVFRPDVEVLVGDWLEDRRVQNRLLVTDVDHAGGSGGLAHISVRYETQLEYQRQEASTQVIEMLDDIAEAVWKLSDKKMPPEKKQKTQDAVRELQEVLKSLPPGVAGGIAGEIASRFVGAG